jgi:VWFA-related protein
MHLVPILVSLALLASGATAAGAAGAGDEVAPLEGVWLRIDEDSDDVETLVGEALAGRAGAPAGGVGWNSGGSRGRIGRGAPPAPGSRWGGGAGSLPPIGDLERRAAEHFEELGRALDLLQISRADDQILVRDANRETRVSFLDGRVVANGLGSRTLSRFEGATLVVETRGFDGGRTDRFELEPSGDRLVVTTDLDGDAAPGRTRNLTIRTVYERIEADGGVAEGRAPASAQRRSEREAPARADPAARTETVSARVVDAGAPARREQPDQVAPDAHESAGEPEEPDDAASGAATSIRLLPPAVHPGQLLRGKVQLEALTIDPAIQIVEFLLDGERVERRDLPPFEARIALADPPREQVVEAVGYSGRGRRLGSDRIVLNRLDPLFRVRIVGFDGTLGEGQLAVRAEVSVPREAALERVTFFRNQEALTTLAAADLPASPGGVVTGAVSTADLGAQDYVRVVARLRDGRELEDVELLQGGGSDFSEELDVRLIQLQVLAVDRAGRPVSDLVASDFTVREDREPRTIDRVYPSRDVSLVLGLAIDSSGSMDPLWGAVRQAAEQFLSTTLTERDQAFLVDFDEQLRLLQGVTGDKNALYRALDRLQPQGGTALYDSILFSLLQYQGEPGRRALIVLTDGFDSASEADPERAIELGQRLGVPVYVIAMRSPYEGPAIQPSRPGFGQRGGGFSSASMARNNLRLITDPTGGRLFQVGSIEQVHNAFAQIQDELRHQYVLTYYSERTPEQGPAPEVGVERKGIKVKTAIPLDLAQ